MKANENSQQSLFPLGEKNEKYAAYFTGQSYLQMLVADAEIPASVANVTFEPGCRNHWHIHIKSCSSLAAQAGIKKRDKHRAHCRRAMSSSPIKA